MTVAWTNIRIYPTHDVWMNSHCCRIQSLYNAKQWKRHVCLTCTNESELKQGTLGPFASRRSKRSVWQMSRFRIATRILHDKNGIGHPAAPVSSSSSHRISGRNKALLHVLFSTVNINVNINVNVNVYMLFCISSQSFKISDILKRVSWWSVLSREVCVQGRSTKLAPPPWTHWLHSLETVTITSLPPNIRPMLHAWEINLDLIERFTSHVSLPLSIQHHH